MALVVVNKKHAVSSLSGNHLTWHRCSMLETQRVRRQSDVSKMPSCRQKAQGKQDACRHPIARQPKVLLLDKGVMLGYPPSKT